MFLLLSPKVQFYKFLMKIISFMLRNAHIDKLNESFEREKNRTESLY